jgi:protein ImuB
MAGLRLADGMLATLQRLGLERIGDLYDLPRKELSQHLGGEPCRRLDQALGRLPEPLSPRRPVAERRSRLDFAEPVGRPEDVSEATRRLLGDLCRRLGTEHLGARRLELALYRTDAKVEWAEIGTSRPSRDPVHLLRLFAERLDRLDFSLKPGEGIETMILSALLCQDLGPVQGEFGGGQTRAEPAGAATALLVDRLANRLGPASVHRLAVRDSHIPERAVAAVDAMPERGSTVAALRQGSTGTPPIGWPPGQARPIRLLERPYPIEATAPIPDDPPLAFRWRGRIHRVRRSEGPERIAPEWWYEDPGLADIRDYYRVEDDEGRRFWLYRQGLFHPEADHPPRWFLHGFFV